MQGWGITAHEYKCPHWPEAEAVYSGWEPPDVSGENQGPLKEQYVLLTS